MESKHYIPIKRISLSEQKLILRARYPNSKCFIKKNTLVWTGDIRPSALSRYYHVKIIYRDCWLRPNVILYGDVPGITRTDFPHHFKLDQERKTVELCLHLPYEFNGKTQIIADLIIPWTQDGLFFYEIWLATGNWCGGGHKTRL